MRVVGPSGMETFLAHGHEVYNQDAATHYPHPSNAWQAADAYRQKAQKIWPCLLYTDVIDTRDPESVVPA